MLIMLMIGIMRMRRGRLGIESRLDRRDGRAEPHRHRLEHMIAPHAQRARRERHVGMAIAEMPGQADEIERRCRRHFGERLGHADDAYDRAAVEHEPVAVAQRPSVRQVEQERRALLTGQHHAPAVALVGVEHHAVDDPRVVDITGTNHGSGAQHGGPQPRKWHATAWPGRVCRSGGGSCAQNGSWRIGQRVWNGQPEGG